jgi:hypothetical protein
MIDQGIAEFAYMADDPACGRETLLSAHWSFPSLAKWHSLQPGLDGLRIATASDKGTVRVSDAASGEQLHFIKLHPGSD